MNKFIIFFSIFFVKHTYAYDTLNFSTDIDKLNDLTKKYSVYRKKFEGADYSNFMLFRALILNDYLVNDNFSNKLSAFFCYEDNDKDQLINLLKWKIAIYKTDIELNKLGILCKKQIIKARKMIDENFSEVDYADAYIEYYNYLNKSGSDDFLLKNTLLRESLYKKPDVKVLEFLINNLKSENLTEGEWNASILAARYGSKKGFENMIRIAKDPEPSFMKKVKEYLW